MKLLFIFLSICLITSCQSAEELKRKQYFVEGLELYKTNCANCHQLDGKGLEGLYPPISAEYISKNKLKVICLMHNGLKDTLKLNGKIYNQPMPANKNLERLELAEIATYIYNKWGGETIITDISDVERALSGCK